MSRKYEEAMSAGSGKAIGALLKQITSLPPAEVVPFLSGLVVYAVEFLRDEGRHDEYARGLLQAGLDTLAKPPRMSLVDKRGRSEH